MEVILTEIPDVKIVVPDKHRDARGYFAELYCKESERGLKFDDPALGIRWPWPGRDYLLSEKDTKHPTLKDIQPWEE